MYTGEAQALIVGLTLVAVGVLLLTSFRPGVRVRNTLFAAIILLIGRLWLFSGDNALPFVGVVWSRLGLASAVLILIGAVLHRLRSNARLAWLAGLAAVIITAISPIWVDSTNTMAPAQAEAAEEAEPDEPDETTTTTIEEEVVEDALEGISDEDAKKVAEQLSETFVGYEPDEIQLGGNMKGAGYAEERGAAAFTNRTLETKPEVCSYIAEDTVESNEAEAGVKIALETHTGEFDRISSGDCSGYLLVCAKVASQILGTSYMQDGKMLVSTHGWREVGPNDCIWVYITQEYVVVPQASIRADCGNPGLTYMVPIRPGTPPAPPIEVPPVEGKDYFLIADGVQTPVAPEPVREPAVTTTTVASGGSSTPATTVVPDVPNNPRCPGANCPGNPSTTTSTTPEPTPTTSIPPGGDPGEPGSG